MIPTGLVGGVHDPDHYSANWNHPMRFYQKLSLLLAGLGAGMVHAQALEQVGTKNWTYTLTPYAWAASLSGDVSVFGAPKAHVNSSFSSLKKDLDFAGMLVGTARKDRLGVFADITYIKASAGASLPAGLPVRQVRLGAKAFTAMLGGGYAVWYGEHGHIDLLGAVRYWDVNATLTLEGGYFNHLERKDGDNWADALVGLRGVRYLTDQIYVSGWALAGGGGSKFSWDVAAGLGYRFNSTFSAQLGYRALGVDYSRNRFHYKMVHKGPAVGLTWRF